METTPTSENTSATETAPRPCLKGEIECRGFSLLTGGDYPKVSMITEYGTMFVKLSDHQIANLIEIGSAYLSKKIRGGTP